MKLMQVAVQDALSQVLHLKLRWSDSLRDQALYSALLLEVTAPPGT